jgi:beta-phosphoglucomutase family hydrolase
MDWSSYAAVLFDLDGVLTPTAEVHMRAWDETFNGYLAGIPGQRPYTDADYFAFVDGKPRYDGVRDMLASRGIALPEGTPDDDPAMETVGGLGNRKNNAVIAVIERDGVTPYPGSVRLVEQLAAGHHRLAVVSASKNARAVLESSGLLRYFPVIVDGNLADEESLSGKPAPDTFIRAASLLGALASESVVVEDAISGVAAGAAGHFGLVVGVDRGVGRDALLDAGAHLVVTDLGDLVPR